MSETWAELEFVEPEPETDYLSPDGRVKIIVETEHHRGGRDEPPHEIDNYSVFLDEKLVGGAGTEERAREIAIEALEAMLEKLADSVREYDATIQNLPIRWAIPRAANRRRMNPPTGWRRIKNQS